MRSLEKLLALVEVQKQLFKTFETTELQNQLKKADRPEQVYFAVILLNQRGDNESYLNRFFSTSMNHFSHKLLCQQPRLQNLGLCNQNTFFSKLAILLKYQL